MSRSAFPTLGLTAVLACRPALAQFPAAGQPFTFNETDLALLQKVDLLERQLEQKGLVYDSPPLEEYLLKVAQPMAPTGPPPERVQWRFRVLRDPLPHAFALPNGSVYLTAGLLALFDEESQLAAVLAHEMFHVLDRHGYGSTESMRGTRCRGPSKL